MKNFILLCLLLITTITSNAQKTGDTIISLIDTINIHGRVLDENGNKVSNVLIIAQTYDENFRPKRTKTDENGFFKLNGIEPVNKLLFSSENGIAEINNNNSRFLLVKLIKPKPKTYNTEATLAIVGKKTSTKQKIIIKQISRSFAFDEEKYDWPEEYPGGSRMLYKLLKGNITYPQKAIDNNVEGEVNIQFTISRDGILKDFLILRDIGYDCGNQVIELLKTIKKWQPMVRNGKPINFVVSISVPFKLE